MPGQPAQQWPIDVNVHSSTCPSSGQPEYRLHVPPVTAVLVVVSAQPLCAAHAAAEAVTPATGAADGSSQPAGITGSAEPWKMITGLRALAQPARSCVPPECGPIARTPGRMQP